MSTIYPSKIGRNKPIRSVTSIKKVSVMKKTLKQKFREWLYSDSNEADIIRVDEGPNLNDEGSLRFNVYRASGGMVIETRKYDRIKDTSHTRLHIVVDGEDLGQNIAKIITMEALR
jgi:hypothetical protein